MKTLKALFGPVTWIAVVFVLLALVNNLEIRLDRQDESFNEAIRQYRGQVQNLKAESDKLRFDLDRKKLSGVNCLESGWLSAGDFLHHLASRLEAGGECNVVINKTGGGR